MPELVLIVVGLWVIVVPLGVLAIGFGLTVRERNARAARPRRVGACPRLRPQRSAAHRSSTRR